MTKYTGGCLCGAVRYACEGPLRHIIACHCSQCRKSSGHYLAATQIDDTRRLQISGEVSWYTSSSKARRGFCGICGSTLFWQPGDRAKTSIFAGSLDDGHGLLMDRQIHAESKADYYELPDLPVVAQTPIE